MKIIWRILAILLDIGLLFLFCFLSYILEEFYYGWWILPMEIFIGLGLIILGVTCAALVFND